MTVLTNSNKTDQRDGRQDFAKEFRLALACARWPLRTRDRTEILEWANQSLDWLWFKRIVERNQIVPLVYHNLRDVLSDGCYTEILGSLREAALGHIGHSMAQAAELLRITDSVRRGGFEAIELKGVSLSALAYGNFGMRNPGDIDLLVLPEQVFDVERVLISLGYTRLEPRA